MYLTPKWPASQPVSGIMIAEETMYDVNTHEIWSCDADMVPWMCGRQTLAIVVSTPCMTHAQMMVAVVAARSVTGRTLSPLTPRAFVMIVVQRRA
jgi:hypothetical protein